MFPVWYVGIGHVSEADAMDDDREWLTAEFLAVPTPHEVRLSPPTLEDLERYRRAVLVEQRDVNDDPNLKLVWDDVEVPNTEFPQHPHRWMRAFEKDAPDELVAMVVVTVMEAKG